MEEKIIILATYPYSRAEILKERLESEGISCFLETTQQGEPGFAAGVHIYINESDFAKAKTIVVEIEAAYQKGEEPIIKRKDPQSIITITTCPFAKAAVIKEKLESEGIECFLQNINLIQPDVSENVKIRIRHKDMKKAVNIMLQTSKILIEQETNNKKEQIKDYAKILVPVDFSENSANAGLWAVELAEKLNISEIMLLHVNYNPIFSIEPFNETFAYQSAINKYVDELKAEADKSIEQFALNIRNKLLYKGLKNINVDYSTVCGLAEDEIVHFSKIYNPDLIIISSKGESQNINDIVGSVTEQVVKKCKAPVIVIPETHTGTAIQSIKNVLYFTTLNRDDYFHIKELIYLLTPFGAHIRIAHIADGEEDALWDELKMQRLNEHVTKRYPNINVSFQLVEHADGLLEGILEIIKKEKIQMVSTTRHKRNIFERLFTSDMALELFKLKIPLMVFHT